MTTEPTDLILLPEAPDAGGQALQLPRIITSAGEHAQERFFEFFAANIRNKNTRRAYARHVLQFLAWCETTQGVTALGQIRPLTVAAYIEGMPGQAQTVSKRPIFATFSGVGDFWIMEASQIGGAFHDCQRSLGPRVA
jgi:hypothetical protein